MVNCKLDLNAILTDNGAGGSPALLFVKFFYHQPFVTSVTKTSKAGLPLFLSAKGYLGISKSETDPAFEALSGWGSRHLGSRRRQEELPIMQPPRKTGQNE